MRTRTTRIKKTTPVELISHKSQNNLINWNLSEQTGVPRQVCVQKEVMKSLHAESVHNFPQKMSRLCLPGRANYSNGILRAIKPAGQLMNSIQRPELHFSLMWLHMEALRRSENAVTEIYIGVWYNRTKVNMIIRCIPYTENIALSTNEGFVFYSVINVVIKLLFK